MTPERLQEIRDVTHVDEMTAEYQAVLPSWDLDARTDLLAEVDRLSEKARLEEDLARTFQAELIDATTPRTITRLEEVSGLPAGAVVRDVDGDVAEKRPDGVWRPVARVDDWWDETLARPITVLYTPEQ